MFDRYTPAARRAVFFGLWEATQRLSPNIEPQHLLQGILREDSNLVNQVYSKDATELLREKVDYTHCSHCAPPAEKPMWLPWWLWKLMVIMSVDVTRFRSGLANKPLSESSKAVLRFTAEEADKLGHQRISNLHLILGLLRQEESTAAIALRALNPDLDAVRDRASQLLER